MPVALFGQTVTDSKLNYVTHINGIVANAHQRSDQILCCFLSKDGAVVFYEKTHYKPCVTGTTCVMC